MADKKGEKSGKRGKKKDKLEKSEGESVRESQLNRTKQTNNSGLVRSISCGDLLMSLTSALVFSAKSTVYILDMRQSESASCHHVLDILEKVSTFSMYTHHVQLTVLIMPFERQNSHINMTVGGN